MKRSSLTLLIILVSFVSALAQTFTFSTAKRGPLLGDKHYGIFYEEINHAGDGGLYAELIRNRSFEESGSPTFWWPIQNATQSISTSTPMNPSQTRYMKLVMTKAGDGTRNEGYWGIGLKAWTTHKVSFWVRTLNRWDGQLELSFEKADGTSLGKTTVQIEAAADTEWKKYTATLVSTDNEEQGWFAIRGSKAGTIYLDMVSVFPPTYKNRENGCRKDLAEMLANIHPRFMRFPGGCFIEGGNRFQWKNSVGPIEQRQGIYNSHWGYPITNGMGFHEFLQLCEDMGTEPLFVVNIGLGHGWYENYQHLGDYIQEALDAVEYANGDVTTRWGRLRAEMGHPEPFNLRMLEIGNENYNNSLNSNSDQSDHYPERYWQFYQAIKAKYPYMTCIGNINWSGDYPTWRCPYPTDLVDEHFYRNPGWFAGMYNHYDNYSRTSHGVYVGEYAVTSDFGGGNGDLRSALGEAIFMAGMEVNSDVVKMTSYAPIFSNEGQGATQWVPDMIHYNSARSFGTPSYWAQQMMASNCGFQNLTWTEQGNSADLYQGKLALSTWATTAQFDNVVITNANGETIYSSTFDDTDDYTQNWKANGGTWSVNNGVLTQSDAKMTGQCNVLQLPTPDCTIELDATKTGGDEGFLIAFAYNDPSNYIWWNIGGWGNTQEAIELSTNGMKTNLASSSHSIETGKSYHIKVVKNGNSAKCYLDGKLMHEVTFNSDARKLFLCASLNEQEDEAIVKIINYGESSHDVTLNFEDAAINGNAQTIVMSHNDIHAQNTMAAPTNVVPKKGTATAVKGSKSMLYTVVPYSLNVLHIPLAQVQPEAVPQATIPTAAVTFNFDQDNVSDQGNTCNGTMYGKSRIMPLDDGNKAFYTGQTGENGYIALNEASAKKLAELASTGQFSVSMNILLQEPGNLASYAWAMALGSGTTHYLAFVNTPNNQNWFAETVRNGTAHLESGSGLQIGKWHNITLTQQGTTQKMYVDGQLRKQLQTSTPITVSTTANKFYLGRSFFSADAYMATAWFDDLKFFDQPINDDEVVAIWHDTQSKSASSQLCNDLYAEHAELVSLKTLATKIGLTDAIREATSTADAALATYNNQHTDNDEVLAALRLAREQLQEAIANEQQHKMGADLAGQRIDITSLLTNPDFAGGTTGWQGTTLTAAPGTVAEQYFKVFDNYQILQNMPVGTYELSVKGFYRNGGKEAAYLAHTKQTEKLSAEYYLQSDDNEVCAPFMSLYDESTNYVHYNYPDNVQDAEKAFHVSNFFQNDIISLDMTETSNLTVGLRKRSYVPSDWACFDDVRLFFIPSKATAINDIEQKMSDSNLPIRWYTPDGRPINPNTQQIPLRISNQGKKVVKN